MSTLAGTWARLEPGRISAGASGRSTIGEDFIPLPLSSTSRSEWRGWLVVASLLLITTIISGTINVGLPALDKRILTDLGISRADLKAREAILLLASGTFGLCTGLLAQKVPPRFMALCGPILLSATLFAYSRASSIGQIYGLYVLLGMCAASAHIVVIILLVRQNFERHRALATSFALTGMSIGSMFFANVSTMLAERHGWRGALEIMAVIPLVVLLPAAALMLTGAKRGRAIDPQAPVPESGRPEARRSPIKLFLLILSTFAIFFASNSFLLNLFLYVQDLGFNAAMGAKALSIFFIVGLFAKIVVGAAAERWGIYRVWTAQQVILLAGGLLLASAGRESLFLAVGLLGAGWAGCFVLTQMVIAEYFAGPNLGRLTGVFILFEALSSGLGVWTAGLIFDVFGSYRSAFLLDCALIGIAIACSLFFTRTGGARPATVEAANPVQN
jgi:MFS family permease